LQKKFVGERQGKRRVLNGRSKGWGGPQMQGEVGWGVKGGNSSFASKTGYRKKKKVKEGEEDIKSFLRNRKKEGSHSKTLPKARKKGEVKNKKKKTKPSIQQKKKQGREGGKYI